MDGEKPLGGQSSEGGTNRPVISTNFTSEAFRVELRDGERPNNFQTQDSSLMIQPGNQTLQKKKTPSFQITSVVPNDGGEESPDETEDMSDILDSSKIESDFEKETPSYSEEYSKSEDVGVASELPSSTQYGITAVVQQNQSGGLLTSRLPPGITVNVTKGGIALAEADGVVPNDADNLSNRFKIVKIASNKPFKKGRWVCFDFMDSPASAPVGVRGPETAGQSSVAIPLASQLPVNQGQHMTSQHVPQQMMHIQHSQQLIHQPASVMSQQQYGSSQTATMAPGPPAYTSQGFQPITSSAMTSVNQKNLPVSMQQQQQQMHQIQQQMHHQMQQQLTQSTSVMPSQILDSQQMGSMSQAPMNNNVSESSSIGQAVSVMQQQLKNHDGGQTQSVSQQAHIQGVSTSVPLSQTMMSQQSLQYQPMPQQHVQQLPQTLPSQHSIPSQQQAQVSISQMQQTSQLQQQQPGKQEQMNAIQDQSPNSHSTPNYQPSQQQSQMGVQPLNLSAQAQTQLSSTQSSSQLTTAQHQVPPQSGAAQVSQGSLAHTSGMSSFVPPPTQTTTAASVSSQMNVSAVATPAQIVSGQGIPSIVPETTEGASEQVAASDENTPGDEDKASLQGLAATLSEQLRSPEPKPNVPYSIISAVPGQQAMAGTLPDSFSYCEPGVQGRAAGCISTSNDTSFKNVLGPAQECAARSSRFRALTNEPSSRAHSVPPQPEQALMRMASGVANAKFGSSLEPSVESLQHLDTLTQPTFSHQELVMSLEAARKGSIEGTAVVSFEPKSGIFFESDANAGAATSGDQCQWANLAPTAMQKRQSREGPCPRGLRTLYGGRPDSSSLESIPSGRVLRQSSPAPSSVSSIPTTYILGGDGPMPEARLHYPPPVTSSKMFYRLDHSSSAGHLPCVYDTEVDDSSRVVETVRMSTRPIRPHRLPNHLYQDSNSGLPRETSSLPPPSPVDSQLRDTDSPSYSASTASTVAIDNKIEQAMDLVKSHLMFAVREEVDVLKERIGELMERINHLEYENTVLRKYASPEVLQQLQHPSANP